jgi:hypothetical protein
MSYAFYYDVPGTEELYRRIKAEIGDEPPKGQVVHLVARCDGGLRHFNVWESRQDWERFRQERVGPAVGKVLAAAGITERPPEPVEQRLDVVDIMVRDTTVPR